MQVGIESEEIRAAILASSQVEERGIESYYPLLLDLLAKRLHQLPRLLGRAPTAADVALESGNLDDRLAEIVGIIIRDFPDHKGLRDMVDYIAISGGFDRPLVEFINEEFKTYLSGGGFKQVTALTFIDQREDGFFDLHQKVAEALRSVMGKNDQESMKQGQDTLIDHLLGRCLTEDAKEIIDLNLKLFSIAAEIRLRQSPNGYVSWLASKGSIL